MWSFKTTETIRLGLQSLRLHKMRSTLTMLGVVFGVCAVIVMLAITEGLSWEAQEQIRRLGATNILVLAVKPPEDLSGTATRQYVLEYGLTYDDAERIATTIPRVKVVAPAREIRKTVRYRTRATEARAFGTVPWYLDLYRLQVQRGRFLNSVDLRKKSKTCVLGLALVKRLFMHEDPVGKDVKVGSDYYRVVGVLGARGSMEVQAGSSGGKSFDELIYIPLTTVQGRYGDLIVDRRS
ncbi:MAG: ABC transporter permease, partial [Phycisphaerae bacterium]|nr:ABC transporter permease [Phycisphaerae bacterium]